MHSSNNHSHPFAYLRLTQLALSDLHEELVFVDLILGGRYQRDIYGH